MPLTDILQDELMEGYTLQEYIRNLFCLGMFFLMMYCLDGRLEKICGM